MRIGDEHRFAGIEQLRRLGHEVNAALDDHIRVRLPCLLRELQAVAQDVAHTMENLRRHVVMRQDDGIPLALEVADRLDIRRMSGPFQRRDDALDAGIERFQLADRLTDESGVEARMRRHGLAQLPFHGAMLRTPHRLNSTVDECHCYFAPFWPHRVMLHLSITLPANRPFSYPFRSSRLLLMLRTTIR